VFLSLKGLLFVERLDWERVKKKLGWAKSLAAAIRRLSP